jgi:AcrR family transcriptional regulator
VFVANNSVRGEGRLTELDEEALLPRGRHSLSRDQVVTSQRRRMLAAVVAAVAEKGYGRASVADVIGRARVSRETFYEQFADKEDCFLAAYDVGVEMVLAAMRDGARTGGGAGPDGAAGAPGEPPVERFGRALAAYLRTLAGQPTFARGFLIEVYAAGPRALAQRMELQSRFVDLVAELFGARSAGDRFACESLVAAISSLVTTRLGAGLAEELPALHAPVMDLVRRFLPESPSAAAHQAGTAPAARSRPAQEGQVNRP